MSSAPCTQWNAGVMAFLGGAAFVLQLIGAASDDWYNDKETGEHFGIFRECPIGESVMSCVRCACVLSPTLCVYSYRAAAPVA